MHFNKALPPPPQDTWLPRSGCYMTDHHNRHAYPILPQKGHDLYLRTPPPPRCVPVCIMKIRKR
jgi:hypothetical protein